MWWIILIIVLLIIFLIVIAVIASNSNNSCNKPCNDMKEDIPKVVTESNIINNDICVDDTILLSCGDELQLKSCDNHGRIGNYQYIRVHKGIKTYIPFRPTKIQGDYKTCIITCSNDEIDYAIIHKKEYGDLKPLPYSYRKIYVIIY